jgi:hypothetical protein
MHSDMMNQLMKYIVNMELGYDMYIVEWGHFMH